jgi:hypothetical protein
MIGQRSLPTGIAEVVRIGSLQPDEARQRAPDTATSGRWWRLVAVFGETVPGSSPARLLAQPNFLEPSRHRAPVCATDPCALVFLLPVTAAGKSDGRRGS